MAGAISTSAEPASWRDKRQLWTCDTLSHMDITVLDGYC